MANMRFLEKCEACDHQEQLNWRPRIMDVDQDIIEAENAPALRDRIIQKGNGGFLFEGQWVYHLTKTHRWIERMQIALYRANGNSFKRPPSTKNESPRAQQLKVLNRLIGQKKDPTVMPNADLPAAD